VDQHPVAVRRKAALEQVHPYGEQRLRHCCRFNNGQGIRHDQAGADRSHAIFRVAATRDQCADVLPNELLRAFAGLHYLAGDLETEDVGSAGRRRIESASLEDVGPVHARGGDLDQYLAPTRTWNWPLDERKLLGPVRLGSDDSLHRCWDRAGHGGRLIDFAPPWVNDSDVMDLDDLFPDKPKNPLTELKKQDLDPLSVDELQERIAALKEEITRVEAHMSRAQTHRSAAEELFRKR